VIELRDADLENSLPLLSSGVSSYVSGVEADVEDDMLAGVICAATAQVGVDELRGT
jgi:hypothetical protein